MAEAALNDARHGVALQGILHGDLTPNNVLLSSSNKDSRHFVAQVGSKLWLRAASGAWVLSTHVLARPSSSFRELAAVQHTEERRLPAALVWSG